MNYVKPTCHGDFSNLKAFITEGHSGLCVIMEMLTHLIFSDYLTGLPSYEDYIT